MAIKLEDITEIDLEGEGSFDVLMRTLRLHIAEAVTDNEITQSEAGAIYTGVIPSIVQQSVEFELRKDLVAQQILTEIQNTENSKLQGTLISRQTAQIEEQMRLAELARIDNELTTAKQRDSIDKDIESKTIQDGLVQRNIVNAEKEIEVKTAQIIGLNKDNEVKDQNIANAKAQVAVTERQVANLEKDIETKSQQILNLQEDNLVKKQQVEKSKADVAMVERQIFKVENEAKLVEEEVLTAQKQRDKLDADIVVTTRQVSKLEKDIEVTDEQIKIAKAEVAVKEKSLEKLVSDIALTTRQVAMVEAQTAEQLTDTGRKSAWSAKDLEVKDAEIANRLRATAKVENDMLLDNEKLKLSKVPSVLR